MSRFLPRPESPHGAQQVPDSAREAESRRGAQGRAERRQRQRRRVFISCAALPRPQPRAGLQPQ